jgi:ATP-binding cassette subfamily B (MDR/TAP) protein 1
MMPDRHDDGADLASGEDVGVTGRDDLGKSEPNIKSESPAALPAPTVIGPSFSQERSITSRTSMAEDDIKKTTRPSSPTDIQPGPVVVVVSSDTQKIGDPPAKMPSPTADSAVQNVQGPPGSLNADEAEPPDPFDGLPDDEIAILKRQIDISGQSYGVSTFFRYATRMDILIMIVSAVCAAAVGAALPLMTIIFGGLQGVFADYLSVQTLDLGGFESAIAGYVLYFVYIAIGTFVASYISTVGFIYTGERITDKIRYEYLASCLRQNIGYFDKFGTGEFTTKITADATTVQDGISEKFGLFISAISTFVTGFAIGFIFSWKLTLILSATLFALLLNAGVATTFMVKHSVPMMSAFSESGTFVEEVFSSVRIAIAFGTQGRLTEQYDKKLEPVQKWGTKVKYSISVMTAVSMAITYWNYGLGFWQGSAFLARGDLTISKMITVMMAVMMGAFNMSAMGPYFQSFIGAVSAAKDMFRTIDRQSPLDPSADEGDKIPDLQGHIRLENIKHIYPSRPNVTVMDGVSIDVPAGKVTALVGSSGCGKSTIVGLVERFYEPVGGAVFLDDRNINTLSLRWLRQQMSLVGQEPTLFAVSIHDNIRFGLIGTDHETADEEKQRQLVEDAARQANAHEFITQLPEGYETNVGQRGFLLSGGQKQRIAIARAIVSNPKGMFPVVFSFYSLPNFLSIIMN